MSDLNVQHEKNEAALVAETVRRLVEQRDHPNAGTPEHVAHCFGLACETLGIAPENEAAAERIMFAVSLEIKAARGMAERVANDLKIPDYLKRR